jgi:hypothetical protein
MFSTREQWDARNTTARSSAATAHVRDPKWWELMKCAMDLFAPMSMMIPFLGSDAAKSSHILLLFLALLKCTKEWAHDPQNLFSIDTRNTSMKLVAERWQGTQCGTGSIRKVGLQKPVHDVAWLLDPYALAVSKTLFPDVSTETARENCKAVAVKFVNEADEVAKDGLIALHMREIDSYLA